MTSIARRAGAELLRTIAQTLDPGAESARALLYAKAVNDTPQFFVQSPDYPRQISGTEANYWNKPLVAHPLDDEFDSTVLDPAWTVSGVAPGAIDPYSAAGGVYQLHTQRRPSWLMVQGTTAVTPSFSKDITSIVADGDFFVYVRMSFNTRASTIPGNDANATLMLSVAGGFDANNWVGMAVNESDANVAQAEFSKVDGGAASILANTSNMFSGTMGMQPIEAVGMTRRGNTIDGWAFGASGHSIWLGSTALGFAIGTANLRFQVTSTVAPGIGILGADFIRFREGSTWLP